MIRKCETTDIDTVLEIWLEASKKSHDFIEASFWESQLINMREVYLPKSEIYVYEKEGTVAGFYALQLNTLAAIFVKPEWQGNGIGHALISHAKSKCKTLVLTVYKENLSSYRFYLGHGFSVVREQIDTHTGHVELLMST